MDNMRRAVALGSFDGLHTGHMAVVSRAAAFKENGLLPCALLFDVHPQEITGAGAPPELITEEAREELLSSLGVEIQRVSFAEIMGMSPESFVDKILIERLNADAVCCGYNYHFGAGGRADAQELCRLCGERGIECSVAGRIDYLGEPVSSTRIRRALEGGDIEAANAMLGREFSYDFTVVSGDRRGRLIGAPTINQHFPEGFIVPRFGVYASAVPVDGFLHAAVTNIGRRPSFTCDDLRSETCILNYSGDLYGKNVEVRLLKYLRSERVFDTLDELGGQIERDAEESKKIFELLKIN